MSLRDFFQRKPYRGFSSLSLGKHRIIRFSLVPNRFAASTLTTAQKTNVRVELEDQVVYLPNYIGEKLKGDQNKIDELNNSNIVFYLDFKGRKTENG